MDRPETSAQVPSHPRLVLGLDHRSFCNLRIKAVGSNDSSEENYRGLLRVLFAVQTKSMDRPQIAV